MIVVFRRLRSQAGQEERALEALRRHAGTMLRNHRVEAVMVCQRADIPRSFLWMQHHPAEHRLRGMDQECAPLLQPDLIEADEATVQAEFVDGTYRFPLPACRVWVAETSDSAAAGAMLAISQRATTDRRVCGVSIYRTIGEHPGLMAFLALVADVSPDAYFVSEHGKVDRPRADFHPLRATWTVGRLMPGTPPASPIVEYPQNSSARLGLVLPSNLVVVRRESVGPTQVCQGR